MFLERYGSSGTWKRTQVSVGITGVAVHLPEGLGRKKPPEPEGSSTSRDGIHELSIEGIIQSLNIYALSVCHVPSTELRAQR